MMKRVIAVLMFFSCLSVNGQVDKLYLKNGSLLRGRLLQVNAQSLTFDIGNGDPVQLTHEGLRAIRVRHKKSDLPAEQLLLIDSLNRALVQGRLFYQLRLGILNGEDGTTFNTFSNLSTDFTVYYPIRNTWLVGAGVGFDQYPSFNSIPIAIELRKNWGIGPSPFFAYFRFGYSRANVRGDFFAQGIKVRGHEMAAFGIGQQMSIGKQALVINLGFRHQSLDSYWSSGDFRSVTQWDLNRLDIKVGMIF